MVDCLWKGGVSSSSWMKDAPCADSLRIIISGRS